MNDLLTRRRFFSVLAASVVASGGLLPIGFPTAGPTNIKFDKWEAFRAFKSYSDVVFIGSDNRTTFNVILSGS